MGNHVLTKEDIVSLVHGESSRLIKLGVRSIGLFGSFARDQALPESDVDILVEFHPDKKTFDNFMDTCFLLEELFGRKVEVVTPESMSPYIRPYIEKELEYVWPDVWTH